MVSLFCLMVVLSTVDRNSSIFQHRLGTSLYHPSFTGSHCRFNEAFQSCACKAQTHVHMCVCASKCRHSYTNEHQQRQRMHRCPHKENLGTFFNIIKSYKKTNKKTHTHTHIYCGLFCFLCLTVLVTNVPLRCLQSG